MACPVCGEKSRQNRICEQDRCTDFVHQMIEDPIFFFENALIIRFIKGRPQFFNLFGWQKDFLRYCKECLDKGMPIRAIVIKGRRIGFSALVAGFQIWYVTCRAAYDSEDKYWDIISASHPQAKKLFRTGKRMIKWNPLLLNAVRVESNKVLRLGETSVQFVNDDDTIEGIVTALSSGGATKRGRDPSGQTFDEAAQISDEDYNDLDISSMAGDDHQIIGSTPYDDYGFFYDIITKTKEDEADGIEPEYKLFNVPTATLTEEGLLVLESGDMRNLRAEHVASVRGWRITKEKIVNRLRRYDMITAKREIFGMFISGLELFYPGVIVKPCVDYNRVLFNLDHEPRNVSAEVLGMFPDTVAVHIGVDMAGRGADKTCVTVFAILSDGSAHMVYYEFWPRMKYNNQYQEIMRISDNFINQKWGIPRVFVDITGTQDANLDSLVALGLDVTGVDFSLKRKANMAKILFELFMRGKGDEKAGILPKQRFSIMHDDVMYKEILTVRADYKGEKGHLGDWVASIWCAISELTDLSESEEADYDCNNSMSEAARLNEFF